MPTGRFGSRYGLPLLLAQAAMLTGAVGALYAGSLGNPLVFDDGAVLNAATLKELGSPGFRPGFRWLPFASFGWTYHIFGLDWFWHRLGNVLLHAFTVVTLFLFLRRLFGAVLAAAARPGPPRDACWYAFFGALAFALHPVAVYGVAYLVQRSILMAALFGILALLLYQEGLLRGKPAWHVGAVLCYFLAVFSKEHSVPLPGVALALTLLLRRPTLALVRETGWVFAAFAAVAALAVLRARGLIGGAYEPMLAHILSGLAEVWPEIHVENPYLRSIETQAFLFFQYLGLWLLPDPAWMSVDLRQPLPARFPSWPHSAGPVAFAVYAVIAVGLLLKRGGPGLLGFGLLFPWILFLTEFSTARIQEPFVLYRSYLWMSGLPAVLPAALGRVPQRLKWALAVAACALLVPAALDRLDTFSSAFKLWNDVVIKNARGDYVFVERGYVNRGVQHYFAGRYREALGDFNQAAALNPASPPALSNRCAAHLALRRLDEAIADCDRAISLRPGHTRAYLHRALAHADRGNFRQALADLDRALKTSPADPFVYLNRAVVYSRMARHRDALLDLETALQLDPTLAQARSLHDSVMNAINRAGNAGSPR